jgi:hypothetical protein
MRPAPHAGLRAGSLNVVCLHSPFDGSEGFLFLPQEIFPPALVSVKPSRGVVPRDKTQIRKMKKNSLFALAFASLVINSYAGTNFAARVVSYDPGLGFADGYTNTSAVLGEPSRINPFSDAVEPFNPPYGKEQVLSIGEGGSLTIQFDRPVHNAPNKAFKLDFIIFGNSGFIITNDFDPNTYEWIGTPATDGTLFGANPGETRVSVSKDGKKWFVLDPLVAPNLDVLFPPDGTGDFRIPVNPELTAADFAGATTEDIRALYQGSGGGTGYNISWARNDHGRKVELPFIRYVRIEVLSGKVEVDGLVATKRNSRR